MQHANENYSFFTLLIHFKKVACIILEVLFNKQNITYFDYNNVILNFVSKLETICSTLCDKTGEILATLNLDQLRIWFCNFQNYDKIQLGQAV